LISQHPEAIRARKRRAEVSARYVTTPDPEHRAFFPVDIPDGIVLVGSDAHYWPGDPSTAHRAFVEFARHLHPQGIILNGDVIDGSRISRWPAGAWDDAASRPLLLDELAVAQRRLREIASVAPSDTFLGWTMGNHDARFETYLVGAAPEAAGIHGTRLKDHFPDWEPAWTILINPNTDDMVEVTHRYKGGEYATRNNTIKSGVHFVSGHDHQLGVVAYSDRRGTRWGINSGTLAAPYGPQFVNYTEANPCDWRSGFVVLTFVGGRLLWPETCFVMNEREGLVCFRGEILQV
jgi:hypothetical protein